MTDDLNNEVDSGFTGCPESSSSNVVLPDENFFQFTTAKKINAVDIPTLRMGAMTILDNTDSDNESIVSVAESCVTTGSSNVDQAFVVVPMPPSEENVQSKKIDSVDLSDVVVVAAETKNQEGLVEGVLSSSSPLPLVVDSCEESVEDIGGSEYAYIYYDGKKIPMLKKYLRADYLEYASDAPAPATSFAPAVTATTAHASARSPTLTPALSPALIPALTPTLAPILSSAPSVDYQRQSDACQQTEEKIFLPTELEMSSSGISSCTGGGGVNGNKANENGNEGGNNNRRLFVFPQNCPGFEVVYPSIDMTRSEGTWSYNNGGGCGGVNGFDHSLPYGAAHFSTPGESRIFMIMVNVIP